jgi:hypothetical protein
MSSAMVSARTTILSLCDEVDRLLALLDEAKNNRDSRPPEAPRIVVRAPEVALVEPTPPTPAPPPARDNLEAAEAPARVITGLVDALRKCRGALSSTWPKGSPEDIAMVAIQSTIGPPDADLAAKLNAIADRYCLIEEREAPKEPPQTSLALSADPDLGRGNVTLEEMMTAAGPVRDLLVRWEQGAAPPKPRRWYDVLLDKIRTRVGDRS